MESKLAESCAVYWSKIRGLNGKRILEVRELAVKRVTRRRDDADGLETMDGRFGVASTTRSWATFHVDGSCSVFQKESMEIHEK